MSLAACACRASGAEARDGTPAQDATVASPVDSALHREPGAAEALGPDWRSLTSPAGDATLAWRPLEGVIPRNQDFALEVRLSGRDGPLAGAPIHVRGWMPEHGHGLIRQPLVLDRGDGTYLVEGVLLHMRGAWQLTFDVLIGAETRVFTFELEL